tara:strand:- start:15314 stop:15706 length:393 start_codon:yes stop_codon:yes gene_type:complete
MLLEQINTDIKNAMRAKEASKLLTLRTLKGEIQRKVDNPTEEDVVAVIKKNIDGIRETTNDATEIAILEVYLPKQLSKDEMGALAYIFIKDNNLEGRAGMGQVMKYFKDGYAGQYDGKELSTVVNTALGL